MEIAYLIPPIAYLLGSVPFGYILVRSAEGEDIRKSGSGNIGATNVYRKSRWAGVLTLLLDAGKGYLAVLVAERLGEGDVWPGVAAMCAILGHVFTVWLRFKGGKGVATGCGAYLALAPLAVATTLAAFVLVLALTRYISAASIAATALFPLWAWLYAYPSPVVLWAALGGLLIIAKHHQNIRRLLARTENKFSLGGKRAP
ncbi:MAG: glycerol-3-phosphate 1-O-acyltransferase PlsY [Acidobacteriota bacterium]|jgi:glycerol-3-phosphate acyltransferase PlsY|nr:glycerol-3-phosphate 1-O-acyltransferase PlsY [Acidobacteriota bacterium]